MSEIILRILISSWDFYLCGRFILCDPDEGLYDDIYDEFNPESMKEKERKRAEIRQGYLDQVDFTR